jgi:hypothetical protein
MSSGVIAVGIVVALLVPQFLVVQDVQTESRILDVDNMYRVNDKLQRSNTSLDVGLILMILRVDKVRDAKAATVTVQGEYVDIFDPVTNSTTSGPTLYGAGFGKVNLTTLEVTEFTMSYNKTNSAYTHTITLPKDGFQVVYIYVGIRGDLVFPACQELAKVSVQGDMPLSSTPLTIYENGCPYSYDGGRY